MIAQLIQRYFSSKRAPCFLRKANTLGIGAHTCANHTVPTGRLFWVALSQALRARLRSHRPSGTFPAGFSYALSQESP